jgi:hypothetical protein
MPECRDLALDLEKRKCKNVGTGCEDVEMQGFRMQKMQGFALCIGCGNAGTLNRLQRGGNVRKATRLCKLHAECGNTKQRKLEN